MTAMGTLLTLINEATEHGEARSGAVKVRRIKQRWDRTHLHHVSAYDYRFYINGNLVRRQDALNFLDH